MTAPDKELIVRVERMLADMAKPGVAFYTTGSEIVDLRVLLDYATGSVVICSPELKALMEAVKRGQSGALSLSEITEIVDAALAYAKTLPKTGVAAHMPSRERLLEQIKADPDDDTCEARAHQEDKG